MLRTSWVPTLVLGAIIGATAFGQGKIAIINLQRAVLETAQMKKARNDLATKYKPRTDALAKAQQDLNDIQTQLQSSQGKISATAEADLTTRGQRKQREVERLTEDLQADEQREQSVLLEQAQARLDAVLKKIAEEQSIDVVIDTTNRVWHKPALEITDAVIVAYDKAYPVK